jgi:hypothetical protein
MRVRHSRALDKAETRLARSVCVDDDVSTASTRDLLSQGAVTLQRDQLQVVSQRKPEFFD